MAPRGGLDEPPRLSGPPGATGSRDACGNTAGEGFGMPRACPPAPAGGSPQDTPHGQKAAAPAAASCPIAPSLGEHPSRGGCAAERTGTREPDPLLAPPSPAIDPPRTTSSPAGAGHGGVERGGRALHPGLAAPVAARGTGTAVAVPPRPCHVAMLPSSDTDSPTGAGRDHHPPPASQRPVSCTGAVGGSDGAGHPHTQEPARTRVAVPTAPPSPRPILRRSPQHSRGPPPCLRGGCLRVPPPVWRQFFSREQRFSRHPRRYNSPPPHSHHPPGRAATRCPAHAHGGPDRCAGPRPAVQRWGRCAGPRKPTGGRGQMEACTTEAWSERRRG